MKINSKSLKIILIFLIVLLVVLISVYTSSNKITNDNTEQNFKNEVINNNKQYVIYNNNVYFLNESRIDGKHTYSISSLPLDFDSGDNIIQPKTIYKPKNSIINSNLLIFKNKLFYIDQKNTYIYDLIDESIKKFCDGELQYITDKSFCTLYENKIYKGEYYSNTFVAKSYSQMSSTPSERVYEDDKMVYYKSTYSNAATLIGVNKEDNTILIYDTINNINYSNFEQVFTTNKYVYELVQLLGNGSSIYAIKKINKNIEVSAKTTDYINIDASEFSTITFLDEQNKDNLYFYGEKSGDAEGKYYVLDSSTNIYSEYDGDFACDTLINYKAFVEDDKIVLQKNNKVILSFEKPMDDAVEADIVNVNSIDNEIYYKLFIRNYPINDSTLSSDMKQSMAYIGRYNKLTQKNSMMNLFN